MEDAMDCVHGGWRSLVGGHVQCSWSMTPARQFVGFSDEKYFEGADERLACMEQVQCSRGACCAQPCKGRKDGLLGLETQEKQFARKATQGSRGGEASMHEKAHGEVWVTVELKS
jgi:hypothetical protein